MTFDPHHNPCQRIEDMLDAIASIKESVTGVSYAQFLANREKRQSVAYDIEIKTFCRHFLGLCHKPTNEYQKAI